MAWPQDLCEARYPGTVRREISVESSVVGNHLIFRGTLRDHWLDASTGEEEEIHGYRVRLDTVPPDLTIVAAEAIPGYLPFDACPAATDTVGKLLGLSLARGFNKNAREVLGAVDGCTHLMTLVLAIANQRVVANYLQNRGGQVPSPHTQARRELMVDACAGWREGSVAIELTRAGLPLPKSKPRGEALLPDPGAEQSTELPD